MSDEPHTNSPEDLGYRTPPPAVMPRHTRRTQTMSAKTTEPDDDLEATRGFGPILAQLDDGEVMAEVSREMHTLVRNLRDFSNRYQRTGKGSLTLTLTVSVANNAVQIVADTKTKEPKRPRAATTLFATPGGNLSVENPRQQKLPLREVPQASSKVKDISSETAPARGV